jgi:hypothetical protein
MTDADEDADTEKRKWLLVHNWCLAGWESLSPHHFESEKRKDSRSVTTVSKIGFMKTGEE